MDSSTVPSEVPALSHILTPGSSLHPTFLLIVDAAFFCLLLILFLLAFVTRSLHFPALIVISLCLWASLKWFVHTLKQTSLQSGDSPAEAKKHH